AFTPNLVLGLALSADHADVDLASGGKLKVKSYSPAAYAAWNSGAFHLDGYAAYTTVDYDARRNLRIGGATLSATADPDGKAYTGAIGAGYRLGSGAFTFGPIADLVVTRVKVDGYVETNAQDFGSTLQSRDRDSVRLGLGVSGRYAMEKAWGVMVLTGKARAVQELADKRDIFRAAFSAQPDAPFDVRGPKTGVTYGAFDLGLTAVTKAGLRIGVTYAPRLDGDGLVDQSALLSIAKSF
ncbi:MAG TPA: autotransporter outer membrane beta-barrel domain-containing protein, partial [Caulobacter sp.]|nr:autotransporter outer membrane beta-barrel domain-containing protein [Caulobacter sp.]